MVAHLVKGESPAELEKQLNNFFYEHQYEPGITEEVKQLYAAYPEGVQQEMLKTTAKKKLKIISVQQYTIGEVDSGKLSLTQQQQVKYSFCLLITYSYE